MEVAEVIALLTLVVAIAQLAVMVCVRNRRK
jgi:hypothetical protein